MEHTRPGLLRNIRTIGLLSMLLMMPGCTSSQTAPLKLTYIANEGVLVSTASKTILIDALFSWQNPNYMAPPPEMLEKIEKAEAPFDAVDVCLVTHHHPDHFTLSVAERFLLNSPRTVLVVPADAARALQDSVIGWSSFSDRVISFDLQPGEHDRRTIRGIDVQVFRTLHSGDRESPQNFMYLIRMKGHIIFHEGDSDGDPESFSQITDNSEIIDLALVHFWFPMQPNGELILKTLLRPRHIGLIHIPVRMNEDIPGVIQSISQDYEDIFPLITPGEQREFIKP